MNYRILLMMSGLMMNFAVFGLIMTIGAVVGDSDQWWGNLAIGLFFTAISATFLRIGMRRRKQAHAVFDAAINEELTTHGYVEAQRFANIAKVTLDDARDILDKKIQRYNWKRTELPGYNAEYRSL